MTGMSFRKYQKRGNRMRIKIFDIFKKSYTILFYHFYLTQNLMANHCMYLFIFKIDALWNMQENPDFQKNGILLIGKKVAFLKIKKQSSNQKLNLWPLPWCCNSLTIRLCWKNSTMTIFWINLFLIHPILHESKLENWNFQSMETEMCHENSG